MDEYEDPEQAALALLSASLPRQAFPPRVKGAEVLDSAAVTLHTVEGEAPVPVFRNGVGVGIVLEVVEEVATSRIWGKGTVAGPAGDVLFYADLSAEPAGTPDAVAGPGEWLFFRSAPHLAQDAAVPGGVGRISGPGTVLYALKFDSALDATSTRSVLATARNALMAAAFMRVPDGGDEDIVFSDASSSSSSSSSGKDIKLASLPRLLNHLTFPPSNSRFADFAKYFLLTYRSFTSPRELLCALHARFSTPLPPVLSGAMEAKGEAWQSTVQSVVRARIFKVLHVWISQGVRDFLEDDVLASMLSFVLVTVEEAGFEDRVQDLKRLYDQGVADETLNTHLLDIVRLLETNVVQREAKWRMKSVGLCFQGQDAVDYLFHAGVCSSRENAVAVGAEILGAGYITHVSGDANIPFDDNFQLFRFNLEVVESAVRGMGSGTGNRPPPELPRDLNEFEVDDLPIVEFARQETLLEYAMYSKIQPKELLGLAWSKKKKEELAPNVLGLIRRFNSLSLWVVTEITRRFVLKDRVKAVKYFVGLALQFRDIGNLNALQAIISGFSNNSVKRLKFTWAKLDKKSTEALAELRELLSFKNSFRNLRAYLERVVPPCIPFIGMYLTDLTFIHEGNPDYVDGLINYEKHGKVASIIQSMLTYQAIPFALETVPQIKLWLSGLDGADDDTTYDWSLEIESREAQKAGGHSKDETSRFKALGRRPRVYADSSSSLARVSKSVNAVHNATRMRSSSSLILDEGEELERFRASIRRNESGDLNTSFSSAQFPLETASPSAAVDINTSAASATDVLNTSGGSTSSTPRSRRRRQLPAGLFGSGTSPSNKRTSSSSLDRLLSGSRPRSDSIGVRLTDPGIGAAAATAPDASPSSPLAAVPPVVASAPAAAPAPAPASAPAPAPAPAVVATPGVGKLIEAALDRDGDPSPPVRKVKAILDSGEVDIDDVNERGNSTLHYVVIDSRVDVAKYLIARGASVDIPNLQGITPLHIATLRGNVILVKLLIMAGADPDVRNGQGKTAKDMTESAEIMAILEL